MRFWTGGDGLRHGNGARGRVAVLGVAVALLLAGCSSAGPQQQPQPAPQAQPAPVDPAVLERQLVADASGAGAGPHLEALQRIADENGGNRASPGPGYEASVDYVVGVLRDAGYDVTTPTYEAPVGGGREEGRRPREVSQRQVIAQTRSGDPEKVVMLGAHLDSVDEGPGINDNASGVAALLETATRLGSAPGVPNAVRFAFWGSEEDGLYGSTAYVESLSRAEQEQVLLYVNLDMVASPNAGYFVQGGEGRRPSQTGPEGSAEVASVLAAQLATVGVTAERLPFTGDSDYAAFLEADIPSAGLLAGDEDDKSARRARAWGGRADEPYDPCYHQACDRLDALDRVAFDRFVDAVAGATARFSTSNGPQPG